MTYENDYLIGVKGVAHAPHVMIHKLIPEAPAPQVNNERRINYELTNQNKFYIHVSNPGVTPS